MVCPGCRCPAYHGATAIECANKKCFHHYRYQGMSLERFGHVTALWEIHDKVEPAAHIPGSTNGLPLVIGAHRSDADPSGFQRYFGGIIDELSIYDQALSESEIKIIYRAGSAGKRKP